MDPDPVSTYIAEVINRHWEDQGVQLKVLAERLNLCRTSLSRARNGKRHYSLEEVLKLAVYFDIAPKELIDTRLIARQLPEETQEELKRRFDRRNRG